MNRYELHVGDCIASLSTLPEKSIHTCVTSPPYYALRDYGVEGQIGLEETPEEFIQKLVEVFREVRRVLRDDGTLWVNMGDTWGKNKQMLGMPWRLAFALQADGWFLRQDIIWAKTNPMPESVRDRCTKAHEYIFLLSKRPKYYFDHEAIREPAVYTGANRGVGFGHGTDKEARGRERVSNRDNFRREDSKRAQVIPGQTVGTHRPDREDTVPDGMRAKRNVWSLATRPFKGAHFATFPPELVEPCILAGCPELVCAECGTPPMDGTPACGCYGYEPEDFELIGSPTGERVADDPSMVVGRAGMSRPRGDNEGKRLITRYEQRKYAEQIKNSPFRADMESQCAGEAFAHYIRTDRSGARPVPQQLLDAWIGAGWLTTVDVPEAPEMKLKPGVVLDPFGGSGTTAGVALAYGRNAVLCELNPEYAALVPARIESIEALYGKRRGRAS